MMLSELPSGRVIPARPVKVTLEDGRSYGEVSQIMINHHGRGVSTLTLTSEGHDMSRTLSSQEELDISEE